MTTKEKFFDRVEMEVLLSNLIILCEILDKSNEEYIQNLNSMNAKASYIKKIEYITEVFNDFSSKLSK